MIPGAPTLQELLNLTSRLGVEGVRVSIPARVEKLSLSEGWVDVKVLVKDHNELDGDLVVTSIPIIQRVPIEWPGGGGARLTFPLAAGDTGRLAFCERSIDEWKAYGGEVEPADLRRHAITDAVFIPGLRPFSSPWTGVDSSFTTLGQDGATFERNANGETLKAYLDSLKTWLDTLLLPSAVGPAGPPAVPSPAVPEIRSSTVKVST